MKRLLKRVEEFLTEDPGEPEFDPVHLGAVLVVNMVVIGCLYWLLWTLLVFEGGIFVKSRAVLDLALGGKTLKDLGYEGAPYAMGAFEGVLGNLGALVISAVVVIALYRLYWDAAARHKRNGA